MNTHLRTGSRTGIIFGIFLIFLILIGFQATGADLIGSFLGNKNAGPVFGLAPVALNMMIFFGLIGFWAGSSGARPTRSTRILFSLAGALVAGVVVGLMLGVLAFILGTVNAAGVNMSFYLAELLPATVQQFTLELSPLPAGIIYLVFLTLASGLGGLLAIGVGSHFWQRNVSKRWSQSRQDFMARPGLQRIRSNKLTRFIVYGVLLLIVFLLPTQLGQYWNYTLGTVGIYVLLGLGLNIVVGLAALL